ncbi:hypothetical protein CYV19_17220 [Natronobacterium gregoryi SP2]|uniref:Uncharacterized protein n=1 Tax=Natronobacterium gregoryi (strain ATCC 43098 / DSM 3393 / CCM 3738 / CIP 104747 / IAM 13177 / JCM 8860 / NBRC 102187 / NCIMB 2189 / SP2) TaxID=797304 RepID=L9XXM4_NATGS|nr:hypothetical protein C490_13044 [Natronobacterium gregoryi SP2]PLK18754.1 hypothetical protein CYV19_17220 [Natronobacterium gregoryi SP2]
MTLPDPAVPWSSKCGLHLLVRVRVDPPHDASDRRCKRGRRSLLPNDYRRNARWPNGRSIPGRSRLENEGDENSPDRTPISLRRPDAIYRNVGSIGV